jgi:hypothetical protein
MAKQPRVHCSYQCNDPKHRLPLYDDYKLDQAVPRGGVLSLTLSRKVFIFVLVAVWLLDGLELLEDGIAGLGLGRLGEPVDDLGENAMASGVN